MNNINKNVMDLNNLIGDKRTEIWQMIMTTSWKEQNIKNIERDPFGGFITAIVFHTNEDLITFKLKYL